MVWKLDAVGGKSVETGLAIGLFSCLDTGPSDPETLAGALKVSERGLRPLLYLLSSLNILEQVGPAYALADPARKFLTNEWPGIRDRLPRAIDWEHLEQAVRTGKRVRPAIEGDTDGGQFFSGVVETLFRLHSPLARVVAEALPDDLTRVLDLGAGSAAWSLPYVCKHPPVRAVAVDHRKVLDEVTQKFVTDHGVSERYELRAGSYHEVELEKEFFDLVYLGHVIHSEGWEASRSLLNRCRATLRPRGRLVVAEWVGSEPRGLDYHANLFDLNMLMFTENGLVFTAREMEELCREAGLEVERWIEGPGQYPVLLAKKEVP